ncbi:MAG: dTMP kinase [Eubacteriales bacterium]|nr:dTMP kinase [Eubacteriales bacterium]
MKKGIFITIEGPDGSGKSTQIKYMEDFFEKRNIKPVFTREPGGTRIGERIRDIILDKDFTEMCSMTEALLYAASRAQHVEEVIKPALESGKIVVCDRFVDSSIVYQGYGRGLGESVRIINDYAVAGVMPDLTILFEIDPSVGKNRIRTDKQDRLEMEKIDFHNKVFDAYKVLAINNQDRIVAIDASRNIESIRDEIYGILSNIIKD